MLSKRLSILGIFIALMIFVAMQSFAAESEAPQAAIVGEAYDLQSGELRYRESHFLSADLKSHRVAYKDSTGKLIAEKELAYGDMSWQPSMSQDNQLCGESIRVAFSDDAQKLDINYRADANAKLTQKSIRNAKELVVDAGFNAYLQEHWQTLTEGKTIRFDYLAPSQLGTFLFQAEKVDCEGSENVRQQCFAIQAKRWWMKVLLDPIVLSYDSETRNLLSFKGLGNIADANCDYMKVFIRYQYLGD